MRIIVRGEPLRLLPERAAFWENRRTLLVADPHFGKAAAFRAAGVFVPEATTTATLGRLTRLVHDARAERLVFLGDFLHAREGRSPRTLDAIRAWRRSMGELGVLLVRGNHDARAGDPPEDCAIECVDPPLLERPFAIAHRPSPVAGEYVLCGHVHPAATLVGPGRERMRLPCFWFGRDVGVLPAFGEFTGLADIEAVEGDRVYVSTGDEVVEVRG